jgi:lipid II:glycine glycyltransferase (peptidoglycan interpeptide bridge formation enzyme)
MKKQIDKFEVVYFKSQDRDSFLTEDRDYIEDLIDHLEMFEYPFIEEVNMIQVHYSDGDFDMVWTSEEGIRLDLDEL